MNPLDYIPEKYRNTVALVVIASPYITRACHALYSGRGIKGALCGIWLGTNQPKPAIDPQPINKNEVDTQVK